MLSGRRSALEVQPSGDLLQRRPDPVPPLKGVDEPAEGLLFFGEHAVDVAHGLSSKTLLWCSELMYSIYLCLHMSIEIRKNRDAGPTEGETL